MQQDFCDIGLRNPRGRDDQQKSSPAFGRMFRDDAARRRLRRYNEPERRYLDFASAIATPASLLDALMWDQIPMLAGSLRVNGTGKRLIIPEVFLLRADELIEQREGSRRKPT